MKRIGHSNKSIVLMVVGYVDRRRAAGVHDARILGDPLPISPGSGYFSANVLKSPARQWSAARGTSALWRQSQRVA